MFGLLLLVAAQAQPVPPNMLTPFPSVISPPSWVPPPRPPTGARAPAPMGSIVGLFSTDDYPESAVDSNQQGDVRAEVEVSPDGRVSACKIIESSGFPALDQATCQVIEQRARFRPARNAKNEAVTGIWRQKVRWELYSLPFASFERITRVASGPAGALMTCAGSPDCDDADFVLDEAWMLLAGPSVPRSSNLIFERRFEPGDHAVGTLPSVDIGGGQIGFAGRVRIEIDYSGKVIRCVALSGGVGRTDNLCALASGWLFKLGRVRGETRTGVLSMILRSRPRGDGEKITHPDITSADDAGPRANPHGYESRPARLGE